MPKYKLRYFNLRGRGELPRLLFAAAGVEYEDIRVEFKDWGSVKPKMPQGTLPVLEVDGKLLSQSMAIAGYLALVFELDGKSAFDKGVVIEILETLTERRLEFYRWHYMKDEAKKAEMDEKLFGESFRKLLEYLEQILTSNTSQSGYMVGDELTVADLAALDVLDMLESARPAVLGNCSCPKVIANRKKVLNLPRIKKWVDNRPNTAG